MAISMDDYKKKYKNIIETNRSNLTYLSAAEKLTYQQNKEQKAKQTADELAQKSDIDNRYVNTRTQPTRSTGAQALMSPIERYGAVNDTIEEKENKRNNIVLPTQGNKYEVLDKKIATTQKKYSDYYNSKEYQNYIQEYYKTPLYQYYADMEKVENKDDFSFGEKAFTSFFGGLRSALHMDRQYKTTDSNGKTVYVDLPNLQQLKSQKIIENSDSLGKIYQEAMTSIGQMVPSIVAGAVTGGLGIGTSIGSLSTLAINAYSGSKNQMLLNGYSEKQSENYALLSSAVEVATEKMFGGLGKLLGTGALDDAITNKLTKNITNRVVKGLTNLGLSSIGEGIEEVVSGLAQPAIQKLTLGKKEDYITLLKDETLAEDFFAGVMSSVILGGISGTKGIQNNNISINSNANIQTQMYSQNVSSNNKYIYKNTTNQKVNNLRKTASEYFNNSEQTHNFINNIEKIVSDKNYNVIFDSNIKNNGKSVNAQIKTLNNGEVEIRINPNSSRSGEFLIVHEVTHAIENESMKKLVMDYASKHSDFNTALESLKTTYGVDDVSSEVLADISGQLFGNQEFINNLSVEQPSIFRKIYNAIISLANKITGNTNEALFIRDLKNKWEAAYRTQNNNMNQDTQYSIGGINAINQLQDSQFKTDALNSYQMAQNLQKQNVDNETIRQQTKWFQDKNNDWKFEFNDNNLTINNKILQANGKYKLSDIFNHNVLYQLYPTLKDYDVKFVDMKPKASHDGNKKILKINNDFIKTNNYKELKGTLLHELQHAIQKYENFESGTTRKLGGKQYFENLGEIEADDTKYRYMNDYNKEDRMNIAPESSKLTPKHKKYDSYMTNRTVVDKFKDNIYNFTKDVKKSDEMAEEIISSHQKRNNSLVDGRGLLNSSSFSVDNKGRELTKTQQEYFKDSKVRDKNGNLKVLYNGSGNHTVYLPGYMSDESLWGKGIYLTPYKEIAEMYGKDIKEVYVNIKNPLTPGKNISFEQYNNLYKSINDGEEAYKEEYDMYDDDMDLLWDITNKGSWADYADEIIKYTGKDGIIVESDDKADTMVIAFKSNQIKNVTNENPTSNEDIRYSQKNNKWQEYLDNHYKATGTRTNLQNIKLPGKNNTDLLVSEDNSNTGKNKSLNPSEISNLKLEDANTTPKLPNVKRNKVGDGDSRFYENVRDKTNMLSEEQKASVLSEEEVQYYDKITNEESLNKAFERLEKNGQIESLNWFSKDSEKANSTDVAEGWILLKQYADNNDADGMVAVAKKLREIGTKAGQTVQAFNILERMTPEGMVKYAQSELTEAYEKMIKNKSKEWIDKHQSDFDLNPEEVSFIMNTMEEVSKMEDGYEKRVKLAEIQKVMTDKLPPAKGAGIKSWMRISMLFNPKTQVRNIMGNATIAPVNYFSDLISSAVDKQIAKKTGYRTLGKTDLSNYAKGFKKGFFESYNDFKKGINTRNIEGNRFEIGEGRSFNNNTTIGNALNRVDSLLSFMLDAGDRTFYEATFTNSINNQMVLNNTTEVTQDMIDIATQEALSRTWQDNNNYTKFVLQTRNALNKINIKGYGLGDVLIPFAKTPANLTKAIIDYSPVGMINAINSGKNLKNSLNNGQYNVKLQHQFVQDLGKVTAGTMLYILGYALAKAGITSGESDDDKDVKDFMKNTLGVNSYSIKIGNKSFTYDWAQPIASPLSIMANIGNKQKEGATLTENIISSLDTAGNILLEQSFMESINTVLNNNDGIVTGIQEAILELPSRAIPTLMKQIVDLTDNTQRTSFEYDKPLKTMVNKVKAKVPGLSKTLAPVVDTMGREVQRYGGKNNIFNVFLNPANVSTENISESAKEIYRLYKETGGTTIMPRVAPYYVNKNNEKIVLTSSQKAEYQKISGKIIEDNIEKLLKNNQYKNMPDIEKADIVNNIVNYSYNIAQSRILGTEISQNYEKAYLYSKVGNVADYYILKSQDFVADKDEDGNSINGSKKQKVVNYINSMDLSVANKAILIKFNGYGISDYDKQIINYINSQKITTEEKIQLLTKLGYTIKNGKVYW